MAELIVIAIAVGVVVFIIAIHPGDVSTGSSAEVVDRFQADDAEMAGKMADDLNARRY